MKTRLADEERLIKIGRAVFAAVGLRRVLEPGTLRITKEQFARAVKIEPEIYDIVFQFLDGKREAVPLPEYDHDATADLLFRSTDVHDIEDNLAQFRGHPGGDDFLQAAGAARMYLQAKMPRRLSTFHGAKPPKPAPAELIKWRRHLEAVSNPVWAVRQLLAATLGRDHIEALRTVWPDVLQVVQKAADRGMADRLEKDPNYRPERRIARQLAVLLERSDMPPGFVEALQAEFNRESQGADRPSTPATKPDDRLQTSVQRIAER